VQLETQLHELCDQALELLDIHLIPKAEAVDGKTHVYLKSKADFLRYKSEISKGDSKSQLAARAQEVSD